MPIYVVTYPIRNEQTFKKYFSIESFKNNNKPIICYYSVFMKNNYFVKQKEISEKNGISFHFVSLFNDWFNKRQLDYLICLCIQSVETCCLG